MLIVSEWAGRWGRSVGGLVTETTHRSRVSSTDSSYSDSVHEDFVSLVEIRQSDREGLVAPRGNEGNASAVPTDTSRRAVCVDVRLRRSGRCPVPHESSRFNMISSAPSPRSAALP